MEKEEAKKILKEYSFLEEKFNDLKTKSNQVDQDLSKLLQIMHNELSKNKIELPLSYRDNIVIVSIFKALYGDAK